MKRLLALVGILVAAAASAATLPDTDVIQVERGTHELLRQSLSVKRVAVGDSEIADVTVVNRHELLVTGKTVGVTSLIVWFQEVKESAAYRVVVGKPTNPLAPEPHDPALSDANVRDGHLSGSLPDLPAHARALAQVGEDPRDDSVVAVRGQVLTEIRIAELSRSTLKQFGFNFLRNTGSSTGALMRPGTLGGVSLTPQQSARTVNSDGSFSDTTTPGQIGVTSSSGFVPLQNAFNLVLGSATRNFIAMLSVLENRGLVRTLAEPSLAATSGQTATFLAGGEFPVPVSQGTTGSVSIEYKEFGVRLSLTPTVLSNNRIALKVAPEVSELDFTSAVQIAGTSVPALSVRRTDTTVELGDGQSFVISGLVSRNMMASVDKVPFISSVPILGAFFKSSRYDREERELIMIVTPHLVSPISKGVTQPPLPGEEYDGYKPGSASFIFNETGRFKTGLSR